eukprot:352483-Chlamydomonas_euryale.AAC.7
MHSFLSPSSRHCKPSVCKYVPPIQQHGYLAGDWHSHDVTSKLHCSFANIAAFMSGRGRQHCHFGGSIVKQLVNNMPQWSTRQMA